MSLLVKSLNMIYVKAIFFNFNVHKITNYDIIHSIQSINHFIFEEDILCEQLVMLENWIHWEGLYFQNH